MSFLEKLVQLGEWLYSVLRWFFEPWLFFLFIAVTAAAVCIPTFVFPNEFAFRISGLALQLLGVGTVAFEIQKARALFDQPRLIDHAKNWLSRRPEYGGRQVISGGRPLQLPSMGGQGRVSVWANAGKDATLEERAEVLEQNLVYLKKEVRALQTEIDKNVRKLTQRLRKERGARAEADAGIKKEIVAAETGDLHVAAMGTLWLFVGVVLSAVPQELACLFK